jgi:tRNA (cytidine56-2'-O)-methyltransferase
MNITVMRLGHRPYRDKRLSTHLILCARALGIEKVVYSGSRDPRLEKSIMDTVKRWGGDFMVEYESNWRKFINLWEGNIAHLTMYGLPVEETVPVIREKDYPLLIVVGGPKVPRYLYEKATWNISVTNQPHSEVSALALFIFILNGERSLRHVFNGGTIEITPCKRGKLVEVSKD